MSAALIHDRLHIKMFWEKRIHNETQVTEDEEKRVNRSALPRLRSEWKTRLENRNKHLKMLSDVRRPRAEH